MDMVIAAMMTSVAARRQSRAGAVHPIHMG
jgi:hypothetical protein